MRNFVALCLFAIIAACNPPAPPAEGSGAAPTGTPATAPAPTPAPTPTIAAPTAVASVAAPATPEVTQEGSSADVDTEESGEVGESPL